MSQREKKTNGCLACVFYRAARLHRHDNGGSKTEDGEDIPPSHITCHKYGIVDVVSYGIDFEVERELAA